MILPTSYIGLPEWTIVGPLGPLVPKHFLERPTLAVDGGAVHAENFDIWVGDSDSLEGDRRARHTFHCSPEKDVSDLSLALSLFSEGLPYRLHLWGFLGGRRDHELFNLGEVHAWLKARPKSEVFFYDAKGPLRLRFLGAGAVSFSHQGLFSVGALEQVRFGITGSCRYEVEGDRELRPLSSLGLSNEARGEVTLQSSGPIFIYFPENP